VEVTLGSDLQNLLKLSVVAEASNIFCFWMLNMLKMLGTLKSLCLSLVHTSVAGTMLTLVYASLVLSVK